MNFDSILKKGQDALKGEDGKIDYKDLSKDAQDAYKTYSTTDGDFQKKATATYTAYSKSHDGTETKTEVKTEETKPTELK